MAELPIVVITKKKSVAFVGSAGSFDTATRKLIEYCNTHALVFKPSRLRCLSSSSRIVLHEESTYAFPAFIYDTNSKKSAQTKAIKPVKAPKPKRKDK